MSLCFLGKTFTICQLMCWLKANAHYDAPMQIQDLPPNLGHAYAYTGFVFAIRNNVTLFRSTACTLGRFHTLPMSMRTESTQLLEWGDSGHKAAPCTSLARSGLDWSAERLRIIAPPQPPSKDGGGCRDGGRDGQRVHIGIWNLESCPPLRCARRPRTDIHPKQLRSAVNI